MCVLRIIPAIQSGSNAPANRWKAANDFDDSESGLMEGAARVRDATGPDQFLDCFDRCLQCSDCGRSVAAHELPVSAIKLTLASGAAVHQALAIRCATDGSACAASSCFRSRRRAQVDP